MTPGGDDGRPAAGVYDVIVVGAGQAGLAMGWFLARRGLRFVILEATGTVGAAWRDRWDSLVLFTPARYSGLPGLPFPGDPDAYPTRDEVIAYLVRYADHFGLPVAVDSRVDRLASREGGGYTLSVGDTTYEADQVVVATGPFQVPFVPSVAEGLAPEVVQLHSTGYRTPAGLPEGPVLVVGGGNTGFQITDELADTRTVHLSIGSRQTPLPRRLLGKDLFWWLTRLRLMEKSTRTRLGRRMKSRDPALIGSSPRRLRRRPSVTIHPRVVGAAGRTVTFADGATLDVSAVVWATGYRLDQRWIDVPGAAEGAIAHRRGVTDSPGLYLLGLSWQHSRGSALIGWVKDDAAFLAERIAAHGAATHGAGGIAGEGE